jgi:uncharacterized Zn finger protein
VHFVLGEAFDRDPFLLFELRGRSRSQVLETLRAARAADAGARPAGESPRRSGERSGASTAEPLAEIEVATVSLGRLKAADYDASPEPLPSLTFGFDAPPVSGALLRQLGAPSGWGAALTPADRFGPMVRAAADAARRLALGSSGHRAETDADTTAAVRDSER